MNFKIAVSLLSVASTAAFMVPKTNGRAASQQKVVAVPELTTETTSATKTTRPIYDPLNLYPESSPEKKNGEVLAMEPTLEVKKVVVDPMSLYPKNSPEFAASLEEETHMMEAMLEQRPIYDPMNLYPSDAPERKEGKIQSMELYGSVEMDNNKATSDPMGLYPKNSPEHVGSLAVEQESYVSMNRQLYDPLGLYPISSVERLSGRIQTPRRMRDAEQAVVDPLNLYKVGKNNEGEVDDNVVMSQALPFMPQPAVLDGSLAGDAGFDPLGFAKSKEDLLWQREAELKHGRIAMLAAAGWPLSELWDKSLASFAHMKPLLVEGDRVPSLLNGGLAHVNPFYWLGVLGLAGFVEGLSMMNKSSDDASMFDPLGLFPADREGQQSMELAEIKNGRLAMLAITVFVGLEAFTKTAVVDATPFFFHPPF